MAKDTYRGIVRFVCGTAAPGVTNSPVVLVAPLASRMGLTTSSVTTVVVCVSYQDCKAPNDPPVNDPPVKFFIVGKM